MAAKRYRERNCDFCGRLFWPKSPSSKTCSDACRSARRTAQKRRLVIERRDELTSPANRPLTAEEELAHETLLDSYGDTLSGEQKVKLRMRTPLLKRTDVRVGMLNPLDLMPDMPDAGSPPVYETWEDYAAESDRPSTFTIRQAPASGDGVNVLAVKDLSAR